MDYTGVKRRIFKRHVCLVLSLASASLAAFVSCGPPAGEGSFLKPPAVAENLSGNIVVASTANQAATMLTSGGLFVREIFVSDGTTTDFPVGLAHYGGSQVLVAVDGVDRVMIVDASVGRSSAANFIIDGNLTGTLRGVTRLTGGDILVVETNNVERFTSTGTRVATGGWPFALQTGGTGIMKATGGSFVHCSNTLDVIRTYNNAGTQTATASSGIGGTTDVNGCAVAADGRVAAAFNGTTDTIRIYTSTTLAATSCNFSNLTLLADPDAVVFKTNGNVIAADGTSNVLVEIDTACNLVRTISSSSISTPTDLMVFP